MKVPIFLCPFAASLQAEHERKTHTKIGCGVLAEFFKSNDTFVSIDLRGNNITQGVIALAEYISQSQSLKQ